jgi:spore coat protein H
VELAFPSQPGFADPPAPGEFPAVERELATLDLGIDPDDLAFLEANPRTDTMVPAQVTVGDRRVPARVRFRGSSARARPQKSFRVDLDPGWAIEFRDTFALLAEYDDAGKLADRFALDLHRAMGLHAPRARYVKLTVNGRRYGVHLDVERVVKEYLGFHGLDPFASIYRCGGRNCEMKVDPRSGAYQSDFEKTKNDREPWDDLDALLRAVNRTDDDAFLAFLRARADLDAYLRASPSTRSSRTTSSRTSAPTGSTRRRPTAGATRRGT